ncbi:MAG: ABC transporter substrate-binding protein [Anaerolineaceae bacterium]|nr:ABC transporter substrate-binding protein [Anaerolineaceae bacterium]
MDHQINRREFLKLTAGSAAGAMAAMALPAVAAPSRQVTFNEAPMLAEQVAAGSLPPVNERVPLNPRVITPYDGTGQYGGSLRRGFKGISDRWGNIKLVEEMAIEWESPDADTINLAPNYISGWTQNEDATEYAFTLREGLKWSDGAPYTTADVQFWYDEMFLGELASPQQQLTPGGTLMELEVLDELSWTVRFAQPVPLLTIIIAKNTMGMTGGPTMAAPAHYLREFMPQYTSDQSRIDAAIEANGLDSWIELFGGAGNLRGPIAFFFLNPELPMVGAWRSANHPIEDPYVMERNPFYHQVDTEGNQLPYIDSIDNALFADNTVFDLWIAQGLIDFQMRHVGAAGYTFYKENEEAGNYRVLRWRNASTNAYHPNINHSDPQLRALFDDARFREAMSISINREEINDLVHDGLAEPRQASPVSGSPNYDPEFEARWTQYDPERASALLDEIGLATDGEGFRLRPDNGERIRFAIMHRAQTGSPGADEAGLVENYWRAIGLEVSQDVVERSLYEERVRSGEVDVGVWGVDRSSIVIADPGRMLGTVDDGPWAPLYGHWFLGEASKRKKEEPPADHPIREIWRLWDLARVEPDEGRRNALFQQLLDVHKAHPYQIGTVGEGTTVVIVSSDMYNVPDGFINDDTLRSPGYAQLAQFSFGRQT